jgi:hypothetical protein
VADAAAAGLSTHHVAVDSAANLRNWHARLAPDEVRRVREGARDVWERFYTDADWD